MWKRLWRGVGDRTLTAATTTKRHDVQITGLLMPLQPPAWVAQVSWSETGESYCFNGPPGAPGVWSWFQADLRMADSPCFHSQTFELVFPAPSTSNSKAPDMLFSRASFCELVR